MTLQSILRQITASYETILHSLQNGAPPASLHLRRAARLPVLAAFYRELARPLLLLTDRPDHALAHFDELHLWMPEGDRLLFPEPNSLFYENAPWGETTRRDRLSVLTRLAGYHIPGTPPTPQPPLIVTSARALMTRTLPRREFLKATRPLRPGTVLEPDTLARRLVSLGYEPVNTVIAAGQFTRRGGLLDVWPPAEAKPTRIEFFGDEIDTLRYFEPSSQMTIAAHQRVMVTPAREYLLSMPASHSAAGQFVSPDEAEYSEFDLPRLHDTAASLLDYLPQNALILIDDLQAVQDTVTELEEQAIELRREALNQGFIDSQYPLPYLTWTELADTLPKHTVIELGSTAAHLDGEPLLEHPTAGVPDVVAVTQAGRFSPGPRFGGRLKPFMEHLASQVEAGHAIFIISRQADRLQELWLELHRSAEHAQYAPQFIKGSLSEGWSYQVAGQLGLQVYTDGEIFGWRRPEPRQRQRPVAEAPEAYYADLQAGDYVVHVDHGIGVFIGLVKRTIDGIEREYLCIEFADEAQLFVPVHQADRITPYVGPDGRKPSLSRLGSPEWRTVKSHVKEAVQEVAEELLALYAKRNVVPGHAFATDTPWQQELEASFPYIETDDQVRVLNEVKSDMEKPRPMDRLICGDVGYGKTEVALRAAFKAVMDGKQVAMLVPTTVLAQQHFQTFRQRIAAFPAEVEMLSRFRTPQQQREIVRRLSRGEVDIVIGTHRLLSSDVDFKDLGLLIIDEEQRFGVTHKEKLKQMRTEVDVLTLTATPIPRTLYMTLTGVRDISTINTPPEERLPIITHVGPFNPRMVRQAILRELERGGQVFFVHNRVQTIGAMRQHLDKLVPEARVAVAHGQMPENMLSERMHQFSRGEVDVLLSTSIIESGLDIPNANTLIVDRADTFGLAQLYQLRGRVGRGAQRAYAYFFRHARRQPTLEGRQRLETIAENTQLGAGFSIAMRDLEIRGAGDLLGTRQHGHIAAVGFHLYTQLLAEAIRRLRKSGEVSLPEFKAPIITELAVPVNVDLPVPANLPADYVADKSMRLRLYRRLANTQTAAEVDTLRAEFNDRFGEPPEMVENLFYQIKVKLLAERAGLASVNTEAGQIALRYPEGQMPENLFFSGLQVRVGKTALWLPYAKDPQWAEHLLEVLGALAANYPRAAERAAQRAAYASSLPATPGR